MDGWMDGWIDGWMDGWMDGCMECCVLLHYFERARATKGGFWSHVSMEPHNPTSTVPQFCQRKTEVFCVFGSN